MARNNDSDPPTLLSYFLRVGHRLAHSGRRRKVKDRFCIASSDRVENCSMIADVTLYQGPPANKSPVPSRQIVKHDGSVARTAQGFTGMRPHVTGTTGNKNVDITAARSSRHIQLP